MKLGWTSIALLGGLAVTTACAPGFQDQIARDAARAAVTPVVAREFPGVPVQPAIDCIIDNASAGEILGLASDSVTGPTAATTQTVLTIATRPPTIRCFAESAAPALLL